MDGEWLEGGASGVNDGTLFTRSSNADLGAGNDKNETATARGHRGRATAAPRRRVRRREDSQSDASRYCYCGSSSSGGQALCAAISSCCNRISAFALRFSFGALSQPIDVVQEYFGEEVAFYFAWLDFYSKWLLGPAIVGAGLFVYQMFAGTLDVPVLPFYALFMSLWATLLLIFWRRRESELAYRWGSSSARPHEPGSSLGATDRAGKSVASASDSASASSAETAAAASTAATDEALASSDEGGATLGGEIARPQFWGEWRRSPITGEWEIYYPRWKRRVKIACVTIPVILVFTLAVVYATVRMFLWRDEMMEVWVAQQQQQQQQTASNSTASNYTVGSSAARALRSLSWGDVFVNDGCSGNGTNVSPMVRAKRSVAAAAGGGVISFLMLCSALNCSALLFSALLPPAHGAAVWVGMEWDTMRCCRVPSWLYSGLLCSALLCSALSGVGTRVLPNSRPFFSSPSCQPTTATHRSTTACSMACLFSGST